jgi:putative two-component system response regulator
MAVADVYDALISHRRYRPAFTHETAIELIRQGRGEHFDPDVVDAMLAIEERILAIANEFADPPHAPE